MIMGPCNHALTGSEFEMKLSGRGELDVSIGVSLMP